MWFLIAIAHLYANLLPFIIIIAYHDLILLAPPSLKKLSQWNFLQRLLNCVWPGNGHIIESPSIDHWDCELLCYRCEIRECRNSTKRSIPGVKNGTEGNLLMMIMIIIISCWRKSANVIIINRQKKGFCINISLNFPI